MTVEQIKQKPDSTKPSQLRDREGIITLAELLDDKTPIPEPVVKDLIPGEATVLFSGPGGSGKSYALLDLAVCVATGRPWLGLPTKKAPVLFIDLENRPVYVRERGSQVLQGQRLHSPPDVRMAFNLELGLDKDAFVDEIASLAQGYGPRLVILDSLVDLLGDANENDNVDMAAVMRRLGATVLATRATVIGIHHTPKSKSSTPRGASALRNGVDVNIMVTREGNILKIKQDKNRLGPEIKVTARAKWTPELYRLWAIGGQKKVSSSTDNDACKAAIRDYLGDGDQHPSNEVAARVSEETNLSTTTVHRRMRDMASDGLLDKDDRGPGKPYLVRLVGENRAEGT